VTIATAALDVFKNEAKKMVVALVDMERAFVPPQHFIRLVQRRYAQLEILLNIQFSFKRNSGTMKICFLCKS
jgi:hypothetical protein